MLSSPHSLSSCNVGASLDTVTMNVDNIFLHDAKHKIVRLSMDVYKNINIAQ